MEGIFHSKLHEPSIMSPFGRVSCQIVQHLT
nr:MAG TPA: hypothetical protein [Caudoviricetes sp.]